MTPVELLALTRLLTSQKDKIRDQVSPGEYSVDFCVHVSGGMKVEEDSKKRPTVGIAWTEAYALLRLVALQGLDEMILRVDRGETITREDLESIKRAGFLSEQIMVETMEEAWKIKNETKGEIMDRVPEVRDAAEKVKELIAGRIGMMHQNGRVLASLNVEQIQPAPAGSANTATVAQAFPPNVDAAAAKVL